jgi:hypothetical protein
VDAIGLATLSEEVRHDLRVATGCMQLCAERAALGTPAGWEAAAYQMVRFYNILEQAALRVAKAFENHIDDERGWHAELINRMMLAIPGVRPAFFSEALRAPLRNLRGFRHVVTHAYDLEIDPERFALLLKDARAVAPQAEEDARLFFHSVGIMLKN